MTRPADGFQRETTLVLLWDLGVGLGALSSFPDCHLTPLSEKVRLMMGPDLWVPVSSSTQMQLHLRPLFILTFI
ncbi:hypothetical protein B0H14DRAFT_2683367 [Mycena olivaceomarginata]|nr:hypothetical protein B0H14DRAFT_2683367 [Mycena olivaceomarginata]